MCNVTKIYTFVKSKKNDLVLFVIIGYNLQNRKWCGDIAAAADYENECLCVSMENDGQDISHVEIKNRNERRKQEQALRGARWVCKTQTKVAS